MSKKELDQFFTKESIAEIVWSDLVKVLDANQKNISTYTFLEPSVGGGVFVKTAPDKVSRWVLFDLDTSNYPDSDKVIEADFLESEIDINSSELITVGNPPFGSRSKKAIKFVNHAAKYSDLICFVLPIQFSKYLTQNKLDKPLSLIHFRELPMESFETPEGDPLTHIRSGLYIFSKGDIDTGVDLRVYKRPPTTHQDFELFQFNRTKEAEKYFDKSNYGWNFAVLRQGYGDYKVLYTEPDLMDRKKQYIFFKTDSPLVLKRLEGLDFEKLSQKNTTTPGFGKADVVAEYQNLYG